MILVEEEFELVEKVLPSLLKTFAFYIYVT